jgi:kynureninase
MKPAHDLDAADPLSGFRDEFVIDDVLYLDGNSLGRAPIASLAALSDAANQQWAHGLIGSWDSWIDLARSTGDAIAAACLGAPAGTTVVSDSTSINIWKIAAAAIEHRPERPDIIIDVNDFPSDRYLMTKLAADHGAQVMCLQTDHLVGPTLAEVNAALTESVGLVVLSHVNYRSGALADMAAITSAVHDAGAMVLWDLSHSVGAVPIELAACGVDFAVGCTYKYLNAGPGAPAFLYVRDDLIGAIEPAIPGWFGTTNQFAMDPRFDPVPDIDRFQVGTPPILSLSTIGPAVDIMGRATITALRAKSIALTERLIALADEHLAELGFTVGTPRDASRRGGHVTLHHPDALKVSIAARQHGTVGDFRQPDGLRLAPVPLYTRFADIDEAVARIASIVRSGDHLSIDANTRVT